MDLRQGIISVRVSKLRHSKVAIVPVDEDVEGAVRRCFDEFGGVESLVKDEVIIKINALTPYVGLSNTSPEVLASVIKVVGEANPERIYVVENTSSGLFTRLVFKAQRLDSLVKKYGATPVYLDEEPPVTVDVGGEFSREFPSPG